MNLAPVILFTYCRPWHTEQTLEALMQNELANESELHIFCDGPKDNATQEQISNLSEVRKIIRNKDWCKKVFIYENEKNKGLANSVIDGVTQIIEKFGKVIVLEDDLITSKYFLKYMNESLDYYSNYKSVFSISGDRPMNQFFEIPDDYKYDVFVSLRPFSTGWGTWIDRWNNVDWSLNYLEDFLSNPEQIKAFNRGGEDLTDMLIMQKNKIVDSWAIRFAFAQFRNHCVSILPKNSYINDIGSDGSGTHCKKNEHQNKDISNVKSTIKYLDVLYQDKQIINSFYSSFYPHKRPLLKKIVRFVIRKLLKIEIFSIKKKIYN